MKILRISTFNEKPYLILTLFYGHRWKMIDETSTKSIFDKVSHSISWWDLFKFFMEILKTLFLAKDSLRKFPQVVCVLNTWGLRAISFMWQIKFLNGDEKSKKPLLLVLSYSVRTWIVFFYVTWKENTEFGAMIIFTDSYVSCHIYIEFNQ